MSEGRWFTLLGPVRASAAGTGIDLGSPQQKVVLAALLLRPGRPVPMRQLVDAVWSASPPPTAARTVRTYVHRLRRVLAAAALPTAIDTVGDGYQIRVEPHETDLGLFRRLTAAADAGAAGERAAAVAQLRRALDLWTGDALLGLPGVFAEQQRAHLADLRLSALVTLMGLEIDDGHATAAAAELVGAVAEHPLDERLHRLLMLALARSGRPAEALGVYRRVQTALAAELGIDPGPDLQALQLQILRSEAEAPVPPPSPPSLVDSVDSARGDVLEADLLDGAADGVGGVAPAQLPSDPPGFTGRAGQLGKLDELLPGPDRPAATIGVVHGMAGAGKTTLAVHWARQVADRFPDGQIYLNLRGFDPSGAAVTPSEALRLLLDALGRAPRRIPVGVEAQAALFRSLLVGRRVLVVLDNARDAEQVRPLLPGSPGCLVLVTSRNQLTSLVALDSAVPLGLDVLPDPEARAMLVTRIGAGRAAAEPGPVDDVVALCGGLPLALTIVAARAVLNPHVPLARISEQLAAASGTLEAFSDPDPAIDVRAIFSWSYARLPAAAARLFRLVALHPGPDLSTAAAGSLAGVPEREARLLCAELARAHLIREHVPGRYLMHDLLHAYARELALEDDSEPERRAAISRLVDHYLHSARATAQRLDPPYPLPGPAEPEPGAVVVTPAHAEAAQAWLDVEQRALVAAIGLADESGHDVRVHQLAAMVSDAFQRRGHWQDTGSTQLLALAAAERSGDRHAQAVAHRTLGRAFTHLGRVDQAEPHLLAALALFTELGDLTGQAHTHRQLAVLIGDGGDLQRALGHCLRSVELCREVGDDEGTARSLNSAGFCRAMLGEYRAALDSCEQALATYRGLRNTAGEEATLDSLGYIHHRMGDLERADACYRQALQLCRDLGERYHEAVVLDHLGDNQLARSEPAAAAASWRTALAILEALEHPSAADVRAKLTRATVG